MRSGHLVSLTAVLAILASGCDTTPQPASQAPPASAGPTAAAAPTPVVTAPPASVLAGEIPGPIWGASSVRLADGRVFAFGGVRDVISFQSNPLTAAALFDPATATWKAASDAPRGSYLPPLYALADGRVVVMDLGGFERRQDPLIYDPAADSWKKGRKLDDAVGSGAVIATAQLKDGRVLVVAGPIAAIYDPSADSWTETASTPTPAGATVMTTLDDGRVFALNTADQLGNRIPVARLYDPATGAWTSLPDPPQTWWYAMPVELPDHSLLVLGGPKADDVNAALRLDPATGQWSPAAGPAVARRGATASRLADGRVLLLGGSARMGSCAALSGGEVFDPASGSWTSVGGLVETRAYQLATVLDDGRVLVALGTRNGRRPNQDCRLGVVLHDSEVLDPALLQPVHLPQAVVPAGSSGLAPARSAPLAKAMSEVIGLPATDGGALLIGGVTNADYSGSTVIGARREVDRIDPSGSLSPMAPLLVGHRQARAVALGGGSVLVLGAPETIINSTNATPPPSVPAERFDPMTGKWQPAADPKRGAGVMLVALADGRALAVGGTTGGDLPKDTVDGSVSVYDPTTDTWTATQAIPVPRILGAAVRLADGRVLVVGGETPTGLVADASAFDPAAGTWSAIAALPTARSRAVPLLLRDGRVLLVGGYDANGVRPDALVYDPVADAWAPAGALPSARDAFAAVVAADGRVLVVGGFAADGSEAALGDTVVFDPVAMTWTTGPALLSPRGDVTAVALGSGLVAVVGGATDVNGQTLVETVELIGPVGS